MNESFVKRLRLKYQSMMNLLKNKEIGSKILFKITGKFCKGKKINLRRLLRVLNMKTKFSCTCWLNKSVSEAPTLKSFSYLLGCYLDEIIIVSWIFINEMESFRNIFNCQPSNFTLLKENFSHQGKRTSLSKKKERGYFQFSIA